MRFGGAESQFRLRHVRQRQLHQLQGVAHVLVAGRGLRLVVPEHAEQVDVVTRAIGRQCGGGRIHVASAHLRRETHRQFVAPRRPRHRRAPRGTDDGIRDAGGGIRILPGDQAAIHDDLRHHQRRFLPLRTTRAHTVLEQPRKLLRPALAEDRLFLVGESGQRLALHQGCAIAQAYVGQGGRSVADRADHHAAFVGIAQQRGQCGIARQVEHRALAADHIDRRVVLGLHLVRPARGGQHARGLRVGEQGSVEGLLRVVSVGLHGAALRAGDIDGEAVGLEDQPGLRKLIELVTGAGLALVAALAADDDQDPVRLRRVQRCGDGGQQECAGQVERA